MVYNFEKTFGNVRVVRREDYKWGVIDLEGNEIVPFGKYGWIDGFDNGLCRVRSHGDIIHTKNTTEIILFFGEITRDKHEIERIVQEDLQNHRDTYAKWGIINEKGEEVLPVEYDEIWNFYGKGKMSTKVVKDGEAREIYFHHLNPELPNPHRRNSYSDCDDFDPYIGSDDDYGTHYGEFAGSYAQEEMGFSDDVINDAFEGDPDLYWNID